MPGDPPLQATPNELPVASTQRTVDGGAVAEDFRQMARRSVQAELTKERVSGATQTNLICPMVFHSKPVPKETRGDTEKDECGYCQKRWTASFATMHLLGNSNDGLSGAKYKNQSSIPSCTMFNLDDMQQLLQDMKTANGIVGDKHAQKSGWVHFTRCLNYVDLVSIKIVHILNACENILHRMRRLILLIFHPLYLVIMMYLPLAKPGLGYAA